MVKETKKVLNIISSSYPFGTGEQFFHAEVLSLAKYFDEIVLFPLDNLGELRDLPNNVKVETRLAEARDEVSKKDILKRTLLLLRILGYEFLKTKSKRYFLKKIKIWIGNVVKSDRLSTAYLQSINNDNCNYHYSFWMNDAALLLAILKMKRRINAFNFRVNGYDIFEERHEANYIPFRNFNYKHVRSVFVLSQGALNYLKELNCYPEKLELCRYGIFENPINSLKDIRQYRIVSCSGIIPLKRIDKIVDALAEIGNLEITWTHFGDGPLLEEIRSRAQDLPPNIKTDFRGNVGNEEIFQVYTNESVNLFVHTSETEGLGMAIIEAQSFGIPAVVIGVGGVVDIVNAKTGVLLPPSAEGKEIAKAIKKVLKSEMNTPEYRNVIQDSCYNVFGAKKNYHELYGKITLDENEVAGVNLA